MTSDADHTLVGTRILEEDDLSLFKEQPRLLREEEVCTLDNIFEVRFALGVHKSSHVGDVDGLRSDTHSEHIYRFQNQILLTDPHKERRYPP